MAPAGTLIRDARLVCPVSGTAERGWLRVEGGSIAASGKGDPGGIPGEAVSLPGTTVVPGFVDLHCHGGGGAGPDSGDPGEIARMAAAHLLHGTTRLVVSIATAKPERMQAAAAAVAEVAATPGSTVAGCHLEGPFLAAHRCGAHDPRLLAPPDHGALEMLLRAGRGAVRVVTLAPELPGALGLVDQVLASGAVAAVGHTDATFGEAALAFGRGARLATHLFNAMRPIHHRDPGVAVAAMEDPRVAVELIADGVHVDPAMLALATGVCGPGRTCAVTDAVAAAGEGDGRYALAGRELEVAGGVARLAGTDVIAGSTLTMDAALRVLVRAGVRFADAVATMTIAPARVIGVDRSCGSLEAGKDADLVVLDAAMAPVGVMARGRWALSPPRAALSSGP